MTPTTAGRDDDDEAGASPSAVLSASGRFSAISPAKASIPDSENAQVDRKDMKNRIRKSNRYQNLETKLQHYFSTSHGNMYDSSGNQVKVETVHNDIESEHMSIRP